MQGESSECGENAAECREKAQDAERKLRMQKAQNAEGSGCGKLCLIRNCGKLKLQTGEGRDLVQLPVFS